MKRVVAKTSEGWQLKISEPLSAIAPEEEPDQLTEYLQEIRYSYRKRRGQFVFPLDIRRTDILEVLQHFYDGAAEIEIEESGSVNANEKNTQPDARGNGGEVTWSGRWKRC